MAWRLEAGTDLVVQLHMQPSGAPRAGPAAHRSVLRRSPADADADDPPSRIAGDRDSSRSGRYTITDSYVLPTDVDAAGRAAARALSTQVSHRARRRSLTDASERSFASTTGTSGGSTSIATNSRLRCRGARGCRCATPTTTRAENPRNPQVPPKPRALGPAIVRRDGRSVAAGRRRPRCAIAVRSPRRSPRR